MLNIKAFIELARFNRPTGILLLMWPGLWSIALSSKQETFYPFEILILFVVGAFVMRTAGCIINDIFDRNIDKHVARTKNRPLASGRLGLVSAIIFLSIFLVSGLFILLQFNFLTIMLGCFIMILIVGYPFMKRYTYWPQLFLGLTFNWGAIMGWTAVTNSFSITPVLLYVAGIIWTIAYDTIYGHQDIADDIMIGVKSTSIKFGKLTRPVVLLLYALSTFIFITVCIVHGLSVLSIFVLLLFGTFAIVNLYRTNLEKPDECIRHFKINGYIGALPFIAFLIA